MIIRVLGAAAGGGYPQWNCACPNCVRARNGDPAARARRNDSLAVSPDGRSWALLNAGPDLSLQSEQHTCLHPGPDVRASPIQAVLLTDAELDHTIGLLHLRQGAAIDVYATSSVLSALADDFPVRWIVEPFANFVWHPLHPEDVLPLFGGQLTIRTFVLSGKPPRYVRRESQEPLQSWNVGYRITDNRTGGVAVYAPGIEAWTPTLAQHLEGADCIFLDGTFWTGDELQQLGISTLQASDMGHLPVSGPDGSAERFARTTARRKVYVHINNTNPMLLEDSPERRMVNGLGIEIGFDGMELEV